MSTTYVSVCTCHALLARGFGQQPTNHRHGVDDAYLYKYQQIAFGQLASLVLNMHKFGAAPAMIKQIVTRLASAYRVDHDQVAMLLKDLDRRLDAENPCVCFYLLLHCRRAPNK